MNIVIRLRCGTAPIDVWYCPDLITVVNRSLHVLDIAVDGVKKVWVTPAEAVLVHGRQNMSSHEQKGIPFRFRCLLSCSIRLPEFKKCIYSITCTFDGRMVL